MARGRQILRVETSDAVKMNFLTSKRVPTEEDFRQAIVNASIDLLKLVKEEVVKNAETQPGYFGEGNRLGTKWTRDAYYRNEKAPFWHGELLTALNSMQPQVQGDSIVMTVQHPAAEEIEHGVPGGRTPLMSIDFKEWLKDKLGHSGGSNLLVFQTPHPYIEPVIQRVVESGVFASFLAHHLAAELER